MAELSLTTIVPVLNEVEAIRTAVEKVHEFVEPHFDDFETLIVESGSTDGSYELAGSNLGSLRSGIGWVLVFCQDTAFWCVSAVSRVLRQQN